MTQLIDLVLFLPENQKTYLKQLLSASRENDEALFIVQKIIEIIALVESIAQHRGQ